MKRNHGFTLLEMVALLIVLILIVAIVLPMSIGRPRIHGRQMQNSTHLRGIHSGMVLYAQGCKDIYPGLNHNLLPASDSIIARPDQYGTASTDGTSTLYRFTKLLRGNFFSPEYMRSPAEIDPDIVTPEIGVDMLPGRNYSYAMLNISQPDALRNKEWRATNNSKAAILSDRNIGGPGSTTQRLDTPRSIHTEVGEGWRGSVCYNDNHAVFETTDLIPTEYGEQGQIVADGLFSDKEVTDKGVAGADAAMVFKDNVSYSGQTAK